MATIILIAAATILGASARYIFGAVPATWMLVVLGIGSVVLWKLADALVRSRPVTATWLYETTWLSVFVIVAASAHVSTWAALSVPGLLGDVPADEAKILSGVILGAIGSLIGAAWLDEAKKPDGRFTPSARQRSALDRAFRNDPRLVSPREPSMERLYSAVYLDDAGEEGFAGWSLADRLRRARAVATFA